MSQPTTSPSQEIARRIDDLLRVHMYSRLKPAPAVYLGQQEWDTLRSELDTALLLHSSLGDGTKLLRWYREYPLYLTEEPSHVGVGLR